MVNRVHSDATNCRADAQPALAPRLAQRLAREHARGAHFEEDPARHFGKVRGKDEDTIKYVYDKIYNSNAFTACTNMPRFGLHSWLTPEQITHIVAFLIDPESPVNKD